MPTLLNALQQGQHYNAREIGDFISTSDVVILSSNEDELFTDSGREYNVSHQFKGFFEQASEDGGKRYEEKRTYVVEKV